MKKNLCLVVLTLLLPKFSYANPVSFKDGFGVMPSFGRNWSDLEINYSLTNRHSLGLAEYYRHGKDRTAQFSLGKFNYLLRRWNELESQANIYATLGLGGRHDSIRNTALAAYAAFQADYETRRIYTMIKAGTIQSDDNVAFNRFRYRAGFSPYLAPMEALQTWLVVQIDYMPEMKERTMVTPLTRFFYDNYAFEIGVSFNGSPFLAAMAHF